MNQTIKKILIIIAIYLGSIILSIILAPIGGMLHNSFWQFSGCWFWGPCDRTSSFEGFVYFYIFFISLLSFSILKYKKAWINFIIGTIIFWLLYFYIIFTEKLRLDDQITGSLIIMLAMFAFGWLLAKGLLYAKRKLMLNKK